MKTSRMERVKIEQIKQVFRPISKRSIAFVAVALLGCCTLTACSVVMATKQPDKKPIELFKAGTPRSLLLAEFGLPTVSEEKEGKKHEIFIFTQGYSAGAKTGRAVFHGAADVFTLGLWEVIGTPAEGTFTGTDMAYEVSYNENDRIDSVILLKRK